MTEAKLEALFDELNKGGDTLFRKLSPEQRTWIINLLEKWQTGDTSMLEALYAKDYERIPVPPEVFFTEPDYLGHIGKDLYKAWWPHVLNICNPGKRIYEVIFTGAIGYGKSHVMNAVILPYRIYRLSCLKNPARFFGLATSSSIVFGVYAITLTHVDEIGFYILREQAIDKSPYFREIFPRAQKGGEAIIFPKGIRVIAGCVAEGTQVSIPGGSVPIESLCGERVKSRDGSGLYPSPFLDVVDSGIQRTFDLTLENGYNVTCTMDHKFLCVRRANLPTEERLGEVRLDPLSALEVGDYVCCVPDVPSGERGGGVLPIVPGEARFSVPGVPQEGNAALLPLPSRFEAKDEVGSPQGKGILYPVPSSENEWVFWNPERREASFLVPGVRIRVHEGVEAIPSGEGKGVGCVEVERPREAREDASANVGVLLQAQGTDPCEREEPRVREGSTGELFKAPQSVDETLHGEAPLPLKQGSDFGVGSRSPCEAPGVAEGNQGAAACIGEKRTGEVDCEAHQDNHSVVGRPMFLLWRISRGEVALGSSRASGQQGIELPGQCRSLLFRVQFAEGNDELREVCGANLLEPERNALENPAFCWSRVQSIRYSGERRTFDVREVPNTHMIVTNGLVSSNSSSLHAIGKNLVGISCDEVNFYNQGKATAGKAHELASAVARRLESRFQGSDGELLGVVGFVSSKRTETDFLDQRIAKIKNQPGVYIVDAPLWEFNERVEYCGKTFRVQVGDEVRDAQLLDAVEHVENNWVVSPVAIPETEANVIEVPVEHYKPFIEDINGAIRDIAGHSTKGFLPFIPRRIIINNMFDLKLVKGFNKEITPLYVGDPGELSERFSVDRMCRVHMNRWQPIMHPAAPRYIHIDLAVRQDRAGIGMIHPAGHYLTTEKDFAGNPVKKDGVEVETIVKDIEVDLCIAVTAGPKGEEIDFQKIRNFIIFLRNVGYWIRLVTFDSYQSVDSIQLLRGIGFEAEVQSVDRTIAPYRIFRQTMAEGRIKCPPNELLRAELGGLEYDSVREKVDHQQDGCFTEETRIPLLDGTIPTIKDLVGKTAWVYASTSSGSIVPAKARGKRTKRVTELLDVVLDSGAVVRCTPEHLWKLWDGTYREARQLAPGLDRLMPINRCWPVNGGYEKVFGKDGVGVLTHHLVDRFFWGPLGPGQVVHHRDGCKTNNTPENVERILLTEHARAHTAERHKKDFEWRKRLYAGAKRFNESVEGRKKHLDSMRRTISRTTPEQWIAMARKRPSFRSDITLARLQTVRCTSKAETANEAARFLGCGRNVVTRILREEGYASWESFCLQERGLNHKVRALIPVHLPEPVWVYDLTVEGYNNFALSAGVFVHNSKDVADAVCGAIYRCSVDKIRPSDIPPDRRGMVSETAASKYDRFLSQIKNIGV